MASAKKMKAAIDANRKAAGEPPRPKVMPLVPSPKKPKRDLAAELKEAVEKVGAEREATHAVAPGPEKPSEATEAVYRVIAEAYGPSTAGDRERLEAAAQALVRRFPGLTAKPKSKHRRCCGTLAGSAPHEPDCSEHPDNLAAKRAGKGGGA